LIALAVFLAYIALVFVLNRGKWFERHSMSLMGPMIMWRTRKGRDFIERLSSHKRLWGFYGKAALWICAISMLTIMTLLLWEATIVSQVDEPPSPELILGLPGVNPVIPLWYGILGLVIAIVIHEFSHGVLTRNGDMRIESLGLVFLVVPIGAFVEPDEKEMKATTRRKRSRVFAAGPASNMIAAFVFLGLFSGVMMSTLEPVEEGALAIGVVEGSPVSIAGMDPNGLVTAVGGVSVRNESDLSGLDTITPGSRVNISYFYDGETIIVSDVVYGVVVSYVAQGFAASDAGLEVGMVLVSLNDTPILNADTLSSVMSEARAGQVVNIVVMSYDDQAEAFQIDDDVTSVQLSDKWDYYEEYAPRDNKEEYRGMAYLGGGFLGMGIQARDASFYGDFFSNPFSDISNVDDFSRSWLRLIALPFLDLAPVSSPVTDLYAPSGWLGWMPDSAFWVISNSFYWIFWLNLMIGLTNVLPAVPLDGGYIFRDGLDYLVERARKSYTAEKREQMVGTITMALALIVLGLILWQIVGPAL